MDPDPQYFTSNESNDNTSSSHVGAWIIGIIIVVLIIVGIILLAVFLGRKEENKSLNIVNPEFTTVGTNSIQATWSSTGNDNDELVLYAMPANKTMKFDSAGNPQGSYANSGTPNPNTSGQKPTTINSSAKTATISGLKPNTYLAVLISTNKDLPLDHGTAASSSLTVTDGTIPVIFTMVAGGIQGSVQYVPASKPSTVGYEKGKVGTVGVGFHHDTKGRICATYGGSFTASTECDGDSHVLYADGNNVKIGQAIQQQNANNLIQPTITPENSEWIYANSRWCLKTSTTNCIDVDTNETGAVLSSASFVSTDVTDTTDLLPLTMTTSGTASTWSNPKFSP